MEKKGNVKWLIMMESDRKVLHVLEVYLSVFGVVSDVKSKELQVAGSREFSLLGEVLEKAEVYLYSV